MKNKTLKTLRIIIFIFYSLYFLYQGILCATLKEPTSASIAGAIFCFAISSLALFLTYCELRHPKTTKRNDNPPIGPPNLKRTRQ